MLQGAQLPLLTLPAQPWSADNPGAVISNTHGDATAEPIAEQCEGVGQARGDPFPTIDLKPEEVNRPKMKNATNVKALSPPRIRNIVQEAIDGQVWGIASSVDIYDCEPDKIRDADFIRKFVADLCDLIEMKRYGEAQVVHFGEDERVAGYSMVQLIETSLISAHFANQTNTAYLDVFSCKSYDPETVRRFAHISFGGSRSNLNVTLRR